MKKSGCGACEVAHGGARGGGDDGPKVEGDLAHQLAEDLGRRVRAAEGGQLVRKDGMPREVKAHVDFGWRGGLHDERERGNVSVRCFKPREMMAASRRHDADLDVLLLETQSALQREMAATRMFLGWTPDAVAGGGIRSAAAYDEDTSARMDGLAAIVPGLDGMLRQAHALSERVEAASSVATRVRGHGKAARAPRRSCHARR